MEVWAGLLTRQMAGALARAEQKTTEAGLAPGFCSPLLEEKDARPVAGSGLTDRAQVGADEPRREELCPEPGNGALGATRSPDGVGPVPSLDFVIVKEWPSQRGRSERQCSRQMPTPE